MDFKQLILSLSKINEELRERSIRAVNTSLTLRNWFYGFYIFEFEQNGKDRAEYGQYLLANIAKEMSVLNIPNTDERRLRDYRQFYVFYPQAIKFISSDFQIWQSLTAGFKEKNIENSINQIRQSATAESDKDFLFNQIMDGTNVETYLNQIRGSLTPELEIPDSHYINLLNRISYTHFVELIRVEDPLKRLFYELECIKGTWSVKELKRQIGSLLYERTGLSGNKDKLLALTHQNSSIQTFPDLIRDPYIFEFIGLKPHEVFAESDLEQALLDHLLQFLLELGKGFCFEARQKRILIDNKHHFIDLVFYHRLLHCNVLIDLKTERFNHTHAGQLNMYLEYYKKYEMVAGDNPPVGILLCTDKDQEHVAFATAGIDDKVFVSQYMIALPGKKELEEFIKKELNDSLQQSTADKKKKNK